MLSGWGASLLTAVLVTLLTVPLLRRLALATNFVDRPGDHQSHDKPAPSLGGVGLIAGVLGGLATAAEPGTHVIVIGFGTAVLGTVGLIDDHQTVDPFIRLFVQFAAAAVPVLFGLRASVTGVELVDVALTIVWIVGITNSFNLLDNMDGLSAGTGATAAAALLLLAVMGGEPATAATAAAVMGACLAFLVYNRRPASIFMGDTGSLFLGFVLAVLTIEVDPRLDPPTSFVVPLLVLGLPVLDTVTVTLDRVRHGRSVFRGGRDHLSHRLVALGASPGSAVTSLVAVEAVFCAFAVLAARNVVPVWLAVGGASVALVAVSSVTARARVYDEAASCPRWLTIGAGSGLTAVVVVAVVGVVRLSLPQGNPAQVAASSTAMAWLSLAAAAVILASAVVAVTRRRQVSTREPSTRSAR